MCQWGCVRSGRIGDLVTGKPGRAWVVHGIGAWGRCMVWMGLVGTEHWGLVLDEVW